VLTDLCIYAIRHSDELEGTFAQGGQGAFIEGKPWARAKELLDQAERAGKRLPVIFAAAEWTRELFAWALLDEVLIEEKTTRYRFSELQLFDEPRPLKRDVKKEDGSGLDPAYIRSYAVCQTPSVCVQL
jgi:hypothetical protein